MEVWFKRGTNKDQNSCVTWQELLSSSGRDKIQTFMLLSPFSVLKASKEVLSYLRTFKNCFLIKESICLVKGGIGMMRKLYKHVFVYFVYLMVIINDMFSQYI